MVTVGTSSADNRIDEYQAVNSSLGSYCKDCVPGEKEQQSPTIRRFWLQSQARALLPGERVAECMRTISPGLPAVEIMHSPRNKTAYYRNLAQCSSVWCCPVCAARITAQRQKELTEVLAAALQQGLTPVMITYTLRHNVGHKLDDLLSGLLEAFRAFKSGREFQRIRDEFGWVGSVRTLEVTHGDNGWHPHIHELVFLELPAGVDPAPGLRSWVTDRWLRVLAKQGFDASWAYGVDVKTANSAIAEYVAKYGHEPLYDRPWGVESEISRAPVKVASHDGRTAFKLLEDFGMGDKQAGALFIEYASVFKGRNQLVWSRGLRDRLKLPDVLDDDALPIDQPEAWVLAYLTKAEWAVILKNDERGKLLVVASAGDPGKLRSWLADRGINGMVFDGPEDEHQVDNLSVPLATVTHQTAPAAPPGESVTVFCPAFEDDIVMLHRDDWEQFVTLPLPDFVTQLPDKMSSSYSFMEGKVTQRPI